jgi:hypothetical protein
MYLSISLSLSPYVLESSGRASRGLDSFQAPEWAWDSAVPNLVWPTGVKNQQECDEVKAYHHKTVWELFLNSYVDAP